jgi:hypothetical protein
MRSLGTIRHAIASGVVVIGLVFVARATTTGQAQGGGQGAPARAAQPLPSDAPFTVAVATSTLEAAPIYLAVARGGAANPSIAEEARSGAR